MNFEELDNKLPNGFHDARLLSLKLDYTERSAVLHMRLLVGTPGSANPEEFRNAVLEVSGLCFCAIEPPNANHGVPLAGSPVRISGYPEDKESLASLAGALAKCAPDSSCYRFFCHDWNCFIHIAALDVHMSWSPASAKTTAD